MTAEPFAEVDDWIAYGVTHGFCSEAVCDMHDLLPLTNEERGRVDAGYDPCIYAVRVYRPDDAPSSQGETS